MRVFDCAQLRELIVAVVAAFVAIGRTKAVLPEGRRNDVVDLLMFLMFDRDARSTYCEYLRAEQETQGVRAVLIRRAGLDIPADVIASEGFARVSDDHLADIALSPEAVEAIEDHLDNEETDCGDWRIQGILAVAAIRPVDQERVRRAEEIYQEFKEKGLLAV